MITADEALQIGLVKKVVYPDQEVTKETQMHDKNNANNKSILETLVYQTSE